MRKWASVLVVLLILALGLTACGKPASQGASGGAPSAGPVTLTIGLSADPPMLDPLMSSAMVDRQVQNNIYDKLVDIDQKLNIIPDLATKWDISDGGKVYTFHLQTGVKFQDGTPFNADAVKFNFDRMLDPKVKSPRFNEVSMVTKVEVVDDSTVRFTLKAPFTPFLGVLTDRAGMMVSPAAVQKYGADYPLHPVGTGPFTFQSRVKGDSITLVRNDSYWKGKPAIEKLVYKALPDSNTSVSNLQSGQVDALESNAIPDKQIATLKGTQGLTVDVGSALGYQGIWLNTTQPPFNNVWLRRAVADAIDRKQLVQVAFGDGGTAVPGDGPFSPASPLNDGVVPAADLAKAKDDLSKGGQPSGFEFKLMITPGPNQVAPVLQQMLSQVGIKMDIEQVEWGALLARLDKLNFQASPVGWSGRVDPDQNVYSFFYTKGGFNDAGYANPDMDKLLDQSRQLDGQARAQVYAQVLAKIREDVPYIYLYYPANKLAYSNKVQGLVNYPDGMIRVYGVTKN